MLILLRLDIIGTFGYVLLAEYRGTQVAVKRVIPPREGKSDSCVRRFGAFDGIASVSTRSGDAKPNARKSSSNRQRAAMKQGEESLRHRLWTQMPWNRATKRRQWRSAMEFYLRAQNRSPTNTCQREQWEQALQFYQHDHTELRHQFVAEMRTLSKLRHPCITTVMGACIDPTAEPMLVMGTFKSSFLFALFSTLLTCGKILEF